MKKLLTQVMGISFLLFLSLSVSGAMTLTAFAEGGTSFYVSEKGADQNDGTLEHPFKTIAKGLSAASAGDTIYVRAGVYREALILPKSGDPNQGPITLSAYPDEQPIIDGTDLQVSSLIEIDSKHDWVITGFEIRNLSQLHAHGIFIEGNSNNITLSHNKIHDIDTTGALGKKMTGGANAILVKSLTEEKISDIFIKNNDIYDCTVGYSEALTISGNVSGFEITGNHIHEITNIGIDLAGHYDGDYQSQQGLVSGNTVENCHSAYGSGNASGIYVDGGKDIEIIGNTVRSNDYGITVGCENSGKTASGILIKNNSVSENNKAGLAIGGWSSSVGRVLDVTVTGNKVSLNNALASPYFGEVILTYGSGYEIIGNQFVSRQEKAPDFKTLKGIYPMIYNVYAVSDLTLENNAYFSKGSLKDLYFRISDEAYVGFETYRLACQQDLDSIYVDPKYAETPSFYAIDGNPKEWLSYTPLYINRLMASESLRVNNDKKALYVLLSQSVANKNNAFYIDTDGSIKTGYKTHLWKNIGADYLLENGRLYKYTGSGSDWKFTFIASLKDYVVKANTIELKIPLSHLNLTSKGQIMLGFTSKETKDIYIPLKTQPSLIYKIK